MFNNVNHQIVGDVNQNHNESTTHTYQNGYHQKNKNKNKNTNNKCWQGCGERGTMYTSGGNVRWCSHCGKQYTSISKSEKQDSRMTQQFHSWVYI